MHQKRKAIFLVNYYLEQSETKEQAKEKAQERIKVIQATRELIKWKSFVTAHELDYELYYDYWTKVSQEINNIL